MNTKQIVQNPDKDFKNTKRHNIQISDSNYMKLKQLGYTSESMNDVITKILAKIPGVYHVDIPE